MKTMFKVLSFAAILAASAPLALADNVINGSVWINQAGTCCSTPLAPPVGTAAATFDVNGIAFTSGSSNDLSVDPTYTIGGFLTSEGVTVTNSTIGSSLASSTLNNTIFEFSGTTFLTAGTTYTVRHDDGAYLFLNGSSTNVLLPFNSGIPTAAEDSTFTVTTSGSYDFEIEYTEINGAPGVLEAPFAATQGNPKGNAGVTPEPSSLALLATGLCGAGGMMRRRLKKA